MKRQEIKKTLHKITGMRISGLRFAAAAAFLLAVALIAGTGCESGDGSGEAGGEVGANVQTAEAATAQSETATSVTTAAALTTAAAQAAATQSEPTAVQATTAEAGQVGQTATAGVGQGAAAQSTAVQSTATEAGPDTTPQNATAEAGATAVAAPSPVPTTRPTSAASSATPRPTPASDAPKATPLGAELAFISDFGLLNDGAINQAMWDGLTRCATERGLTYRHYAPTADDGPDAYLDAISRAVSDGAKLIAAPGPLLEVPLYTAQSRYPDVRFILVDGRPHDETFEHETIGQNVACVRFASDQAGFLAGYSAVKSGMRALGFLGAMPVPEITDAGSGFIQGAEYAAAELGLSEDEDGVLIRYGYNGAYRAGAETEALAEVWFADGLDCIFVCGGELGESVAAAAGRLSKKVILYDEDYDGDIENSDNTDTDTAVFARIQKNYEGAVYDGALAFYRGLFPGGKETIRGAVRYGIRLLPPRGPAPGKPASDITDADSTGGTDSEDTPGVSDTAEAVDAPEITDAADILASPEYISLLGALAAEAIPIRRGGGDPFVPVSVAEIPVAVVRVELADAAQ